MQPFPRRLRTPLHPLIDGDGSCSLVYDAERATVVEVPEELRFYAAPALETGDLDEEMLSWLVSEDLLTAESAGSYGCAGEPAAGRGLAALGCGPDEVHGWIDRAPERLALEELAVVFRRHRGAARLRLHLDWVGTFPPDGLLEKVVAEARRRAAAGGQEIAFELALDPDQVTAEVALRLAAQAVEVRLRCGESGPLGQQGTPHEHRPWLLAQPAVELLLAHLRSSSPPLTVQCVLEGPARLIELWRWAAGVGVRSLDVIRLEETSGGVVAAATAAAARLREYRQDLFTILEETCAELDAGRAPIELQPLTRMVRRLMRHEPLGGIAGAWPLDAELLMDDLPASFTGMESLDPRQLPELMWQRLELGEDREPAPPGDHRATGAVLESLEGLDWLESPELGGAGFPCRSCWARQVCGHSAFVASPLGGEDPREPSLERCALWNAEVETAIRLYHRLGQIDALAVMRFLHGEAGLHRAPLMPLVQRQPRFGYLGLAHDSLVIRSKPS
jgi:hypothetical protein